MKTVRDKVSGDNERLKGLGTACNGFALGIMGFAFLKPAIEGGDFKPSIAYWIILALLSWVAQFYILGLMKKEDKDVS